MSRPDLKSEPKAQERLFDAELKAARGYWLERLEEPFEPPCPVLGEGSEEGGKTMIRLGREVEGAMERLSKGSPFLMYVQLATALHLVLARLSGGEGSAFGSPLFRGEEAAEGAAEATAGAVVIRHRLRSENTFRQLLGEMRKSLLEAYAQQGYPLERLRKELPWAPEGGMFFQVTLGSSRLHGPAPAWGQTVVLNWLDAEGVELELTSERLGRVGALRFLGHLQQALAAGLADPTAPVSNLSVLRPAELHQLLREWNDTAVQLPVGERLVHRLFEAQAAAASERPAAIYGEESLSYGELHRRAEALAEFLVDSGVGPECMVGLAVDRSFNMLVALLGVLKAGAAYVPLDPNYPQERLAYMVEDSGLSLVLSQRRFAERLTDLPVRVVELDSDAPDAPFSRPKRSIRGSKPTAMPESGTSKSNAAGRLVYVIYTSGSTGRPKGVAMHHGSLFNLICWQVQDPALQRGAKRLPFAPLSFDVSFRELFSTLAKGGTLVLIDETMRRDVPALVSHVVEQRVEKIHLPAVMLTRLAEEGRRRPGGLQSLREVISSGEQVRVSPMLKEFFEALPGARLHNQYGPTETHATTAGPLPRDPRRWPTLPSIGRPINNHRLYCLDREGRPLAIEGVGELHIGGAGVARGYHGRPRRTATSFVPDPFGPEPGGRLYRSGDLVRLDATGALHFLSRKDHQVKIRGFRVEPGEIEAVLGNHPAVAEAVVVARQAAGGEFLLVGYFVPRGEDSKGLVDVLRRDLGQRLPEHMVPSILIPLDALPTTLNRKVDRAALPDPELESRGGRAPRTPDEELLASIWCEILELNEVGVDDNFFALGGHSLLATQVVSRLRSALGVEVPVRSVFSHPTIAGLATEVVLARQQEMVVSPLVPRERSEDLRLSPAQERLWFVQELDPALVSYNLPNALRFGGTLDISALITAFHRVIARHEILRTYYPEALGEPCQRILPECSPVLSLIDLEALPEERREFEMERLAAEEAARPFALAMAPPLRHTLLRLSSEDHVLLLTLHHIASDGWSVGILIRELMAFYSACRGGTSASLPPLPLQYADFAVWQREFLQGEVLEKQIAWWRERLQGISELTLITDRPRRGGRSVAGRLGARFPASLMDQARALGRRTTTTLFMTLLAAFHAFLHRISGQGDLTIGAAIANRDRAETEGLIGFFVNMLVMRAQIGRHTTGAALLDSTREMALGAYAHQNLPFEKLVEALAPERDRHRHPLFQVLFTLQNVPFSELVVPDCEIRSLGFSNPVAKYDLLLAAQDSGGELELGVEYDAGLFDATTISRFLRTFRKVLEALVADPSRPVMELPLLSAAERHQVSHEWNDAACLYPREATVHGLFEEWARRTPDAQALAFGDDGTVSYGALNERATALAQILIETGLTPEMPVAFCLGNTPEMVAATLAILKAGGVYVPLDPTWPQEHMAFLLADSGARIVLAVEAFRQVLPDAAQERRVIWLDAPPPPAEGRPDSPAGPFEASSNADRLAYLMYTSGSTGRPKGVAVRHRGIVRLVRGSKFAVLGPEDRVAQGSTPAFDAATFEIWGALLNGGCLVLLRREAMLTPLDLRRALHAHAVSALFLTTPLFNQLARQDPGVVAGVAQVVVGGDAVDPEAACGVLAAESPPRLVNGYGPTEGTTFSTWYAIPPDLPENGRVPIGRPVANTTIQVLDRALAPVPLGVPGQLFLSGAGLARGYHGRPARTAQTFLPDPASGSSSTRPPGARLYATGDLVRTLGNGELDFLGRIDQQVKIRGFRIEPGEVEVALLALPAVQEALVIVRGEGADRHLVAYVVGAADPTGLREALRQRLPDFMVPTSIVPLESIPLNANGKVDRRALPEAQRQRSAAFEAPSGALEEKLAAIWSEVLGQEDIGRRDDFFALGGHSLKMTQVVSRVRESLGLDLTLGDFFARPTLKEQAAWIEEEQERQDLAAAGAAAAGDGNLDSLLAELDEISDEEAERLLAEEEMAENAS